MYDADLIREMRAIVFLCVWLCSHACQTDEDCSLLGGCHHGKCVCDHGWTGKTCSTADLKPLDVGQGYHNKSAATWGGRAVLEPDGRTWSMFVAQFSKKCPLRCWIGNSQVVRAVSTTGPAGPYSWEEEVFPEFHHNPTVIGPTSDGYYLLFMIGTTNTSDVYDCTSGVICPAPEDEPDAPAKTGVIDMAWSTSPRGPWRSRTILKNYDTPGKSAHDWDYWVSNPSALLLEDGGVALVFRSRPGDRFKENLGVAFAPTWNATFTQEPEPIYEAPEFNSTPTNGAGNIEDPFVWQDARKNFHIIAHSQGNTNVCGGGQPSGCGACSIHLYAKSMRGTWTPCLEPVFTNTTVLSNGSTVDMFTKQRPQIVFDPADGVTPRALVVGGSFDEYNRGNVSLERTFVFEFN